MSVPYTEPEKSGRRSIIAGIVAVALVVAAIIASVIYIEKRHNERLEEMLMSDYSSAMGYAPLSDSKIYMATVGSQDSIYDHCDRAEGAGADQGRFLYEPDNNTCYFGPQVDAHLKEVELREAREREQLNKASYMLGQLAAERGVLADDSWRYLAQEFAATSKLPMAYEAGRQAFIDHGGREGDFFPHIAKGGTLPVPRSGDQQWLKDLTNPDCFDRSEPGVTAFDPQLCSHDGQIISPDTPIS